MQGATFLVCAAALFAFAPGCNDDNSRLDSIESALRVAVTAQTLQAMQQSEQDARQTAIASVMSYCDTQVANEAQSRGAGDDSTLATAKAYTDQAVAKVQPIAPAMVPHLVIDKTGSDLGVLVDHATVYNDKIKGTIVPTVGVMLYYTDGNCAMPPMLVVTSSYANEYSNSALGTIIHPAKMQPMNLTPKSQQGMDRKCVPYEFPNPADFVDVVDTHVANLYYPDPSDLRIELR